MHKTGQLENIRYLSLKEGGLGGDAGVPGARHSSLRMAGHDDFSSSNPGGLSMAEQLVEEDEVLIAMIERRARLQEGLQNDIALGKQPDPLVINRIKRLSEQIEEVRSAQVF